MNTGDERRPNDDASSGVPDSGLTIYWSPAYNSAWDATPEAYVEHGVVGWGRSRRLARAEDRAVALKAYLGIQHNDPTRWQLAGEPRSVYFLSLFLGGRTVSLCTFPTLPAALSQLRAFHLRRVVEMRLGHNV